MEEIYSTCSYNTTQLATPEQKFTFVCCAFCSGNFGFHGKLFIRSTSS